jgi:hypothetical protein
MREEGRSSSVRPSKVYKGARELMSPLKLLLDALDSLRDIFHKRRNVLIRENAGWRSAFLTLHKREGIVRSLWRLDGHLE